MSTTKSVSRRRFLKITGGVVGVGVLACAGVAVGTSLGRDFEFAELTCEKEKTMGKKVLIAYASKAGSTGEVAQAIGQVLCDAGMAVDVRRVQDVKDLSPYSAVVIGSAARMGRLLGEATQLLEEACRRLEAGHNRLFHGGHHDQRGYAPRIAPRRSPISIPCARSRSRWAKGRSPARSIPPPWRFPGTW